jgi:mono/diheme cytochrome c family protein
MKPTTPILLAALATIPLLAGCGNERRDEPLTEPLTTNDPSITLGHRVFSQHCNQCHPGGAAGLGPAINNKPLPVAAMKRQVRLGIGVMPKFSNEEISDEELDGIIRYLKALRTLG